MVLTHAFLLALLVGIVHGESVPKVALMPCSEVPSRENSSWSNGGRFSPNLAPPGSPCDIVALYATGSACMAIMEAGSTEIVIHTKSWTEENHLGNFSISSLSQKYRFGLPQSPTQCLSVSSSSPPTLTTSPCSTSSPSQLFSFSPSSSLLSSSSAPSLCVGWGGSAPPSPSSGHFEVDVGPEGSRQVVEGVLVELQSDSIGSGNNGMPSTIEGVPHDLTASERSRFATELMQGFRTIRLAAGLFLRGLSADNATITGRWPTQLQEMAQLQAEAQVEGWDWEYWSPAPAWKSNRQFIGGSLASFQPPFLQQFAQNLVTELQAVQDAGLNISWLGLQNEPNFDSNNVTCSNHRRREKGGRKEEKERGERRGKKPPQNYQHNHHRPLSGRRTSHGQGAMEEESRYDKSGAIEGLTDSYSTCSYSQCEYYEAFKVVAPVVKAWKPGLRLHVNSARGWEGGSPIFNDASLVRLVDAWTWHYVGADASVAFERDFYDHTHSIPSFDNEFEYQPGSRFSGTAEGTLNTVNFFLNWLVFSNAPQVMFIHAAKPTTNAESLGYGLSWWRPPRDTNHSHFPTLPAGHWQFNPWNWNAVAPFAKTMPWNAIRLHVREDSTRPAQRVFAFRSPPNGTGGPLHAHTPQGRIGIVLSNAHPSDSFNTTLSFTDQAQRTLHGFRYTPFQFNLSLGTKTASQINISIPPLAMEWWIEWNG